MRVNFSYLDRQFADIEAYLSDIRQLAQTGDFTLGQSLLDFEHRFAECCKMPHAIGVTSGTDALMLSLKIHGIGPGDEVITTPMTFIATVSAIMMTGARPVFVDSEDGFVIDASKIEAAITSKTKCILPVDYTGNVADMPTITAIAHRHDLLVIEDACQAIGATLDGLPVGTWGETACFSLHPLKNLNVWGEGGVIVTRSKELAEKLRLYRNHGLVNRDEAVLFGCNSRLDTLQAAIGNRLIEQIKPITNRRIANAEQYDVAFADMGEFIQIPKRNPKIKHVYHLYMIRVKARDELLTYLNSKDIEAKVHYPIPVHLQKAAQPLGYKPGDFPVCEADCHNKIITLPAHQHLTSDEINYTIDNVRSFYRNHQHLKKSNIHCADKSQNSHVRVNYEQLMTRYQQRLTTVLRSFNAGPEFLETWVPDDDNLQSIISIVEEAKENGLSELSICVDPETFHRLKLPELERRTAQLGTVQIQVKKQNINLHVSFTETTPHLENSSAKPETGPENGISLSSARCQPPLKETTGKKTTVSADSDSLHPAYALGLRMAPQSCSYEGILTTEPGLRLVQALHNGVTLMAQVDSADHVVMKTSYHGRISSVQKRLLNLLCETLEGKPIQECSDHAVIHLEHRLRDQSQQPPVSGVLTPDNTSAIFVLPTRLVCGLLSDYRQKTGYRDTANFYDSQPSAQWCSLSEEERNRQIQTEINHHPAGQEVEKVHLNGVSRVVVQFNDNLDSRIKQSRLLQLETALNAAIDPKLRLYMESRSDQNKLRQAKGVSHDRN